MVLQRHELKEIMCYRQSEYTGVLGRLFVWIKTPGGVTKEKGCTCLVSDRDNSASCQFGFGGEDENVRDIAKVN